MLFLNVPYIIHTPMSSLYPTPHAKISSYHKSNFSLILLCHTYEKYRIFSLQYSVLLNTIIKWYKRTNSIVVENTISQNINPNHPPLSLIFRGRKKHLSRIC